MALVRVSNSKRIVMISKRFSQQYDPRKSGAFGFFQANAHRSIFMHPPTHPLHTHACVS